MSQYAKKTEEEVFWKWFERNETKLYHLEADQETILDEIAHELSSYRQGLVFEISKEINGKREFIISADGLEELFPAVEVLAAASPRFERWSIVAFRPRMNDYAGFTLNYEGKTFGPSKMWIRHRVDDGYFDLIIYHPNYEEDERNLFISGTYILLDMALGEYCVVKCIRYIDHQQLPGNPKAEGLQPFSELRRIFDEYQPPQVSSNHLQNVDKS